MQNARPKSPLEYDQDIAPGTIETDLLIKTVARTPDCQSVAATAQ